MTVSNNVTSAMRNDPRYTVKNETSAKSSEKKNEEYSKMVNDAVSLLLSANNLKPSDTPSTSIFGGSKAVDEYSEDRFECTKYKNNDGSYTVVKEEAGGMVGSLCNAISGQVDEKLVEEYDKQGNLTSSTRYNKDGSYMVTNYDEHGDVDIEALVVEDENEDDDFTAKITVTDYEEDGSYAVYNYTETLDDSGEKPEVVLDGEVDCYDKNGNYDFFRTMSVNIMSEFAKEILDTSVQNIKNQA